MSQDERLIERWVASWHESDAQRRGREIAALWADDCVYRNVRAEFRGRAGIEEAVTAAHERFVTAGYVFNVARIDRNHDAIRYVWEMVPAGGGEPEAIGTHVALLDDAGRLAIEHQFTDVAFSG